MNSHLSGCVYFGLAAPALTLNLLTTTIVAPPSNASIWQMGFNSAFKGLNLWIVQVCTSLPIILVHFLLVIFGISQVNTRRVP